MYDNGSKFKLYFHALCNTYGIKHKLTSVKNPHANAVLECIHAVLMKMFCKAEVNTADSVKPSDINVFLSDTA